MLTREASLAWNSKGRSEVEQHSLLEPEGLLRRVKSIGTQPPKVPMVLVGIWKSRMEGWATQTDRHQEERLFIKCLCRHVIPTNAPVLLCSCPLCLFSFLFPIRIFFFFTSLLTGLIRGLRTALLTSSLCPSHLKAVLDHLVLFVCVFLFILHLGKTSSIMSLLVLQFPFLLSLLQLF